MPKTKSRKNKSIGAAWRELLDSARTQLAGLGKRNPFAPPFVPAPIVNRVRTGVRRRR